MARFTHTNGESKVAICDIYKDSETKEAVQRARVEGSRGHLEKSSLKSEEEVQASWVLPDCSSQAANRQDVK